MRVGIFGGTFDPPHFGHLRAAEIARQVLNLDRILFMVSYVPPHKNPENISPAPHRLKMTNLAVEDNPLFEASSFEIERKISYTIDSIRWLKKDFPSYELILLVGEDSFHDFPTWKDYLSLLEEVKIAVIARKGMERGIPEWFLKTAKPYVVLEETERVKEIPDICFINGWTLNISSTYIRERAKRNFSIKYLVPEKVEKYIIQEGLYR